MPEDSSKVYSTQSVKFSKTANTPADYAYKWLTDYRPDDGRLSKSRPRYRLIRPTRNRIVRIRVSRPERSYTPVAIEIIRLNPAKRSWHVDQIDERDLEAVDYRVVRLGARRCRIELKIVERWMVPDFPSAKEVRDGTARFWDNIVSILESDFRSGKSATA